ncbi:uncharacterized protein LOC134333896 [Trichomycterus rosablanca]|uniref:uncharacterized protein LOC134333896 n=1 Tax=Trichomycterus rosablanca TaxID=2290929 RepID=UPI002F360824
MAMLMLVGMLGMLMAGTGVAVNGEGEHSLFYIYTALSKPLQLPGIYEFIAMGMLDDREIDYYSSEKQIKVPMQTWMQEKMDKDYWEKGTQSRKSKEQWFKVNLDILMDRMNHNKSDLHVFQWRHGCVVKKDADGSVSFVNGVSEYGYDGSDFLSFDGQNLRWIAAVPAAEATKWKWDNTPILNQYTKGYLEKECVDWLSKFMGYEEESIKNRTSLDVFIFAKNSVTNPDKLTLTCMATGFYPPDVQMYIRKSGTTLPEHLTASTGIRPNDDGSYQLRKCVDITEEDKALYDCYVTHSTFNEPIITNWTTGEIATVERGTACAGEIATVNGGTAYAGEHSLFYIYTALSKPLQLPGIYEFIAMGMLDDREIDYYSSEKQIKVPMQPWMQEKMDKDYWEKGTQSRKSKEQWFKVNLDILMDRMNHNKSDLHVFQWRHGCVVKKDADGSVSFVNSVSEYGYDGSDFLSFDGQNLRWIAAVPAAEATKWKWDNTPILNQYTKHYLEKECVDWLSKFMGYEEESIKNHTSLDVFIFAKNSVTNPDKLTLTCMATGFYPPDVQMYIRKSGTTLPEHLTASTGIRPNDDGSYQLRKCVDITEEDKALYDCYVTHSTLNEPIITTWTTGEIAAINGGTAYADPDRALNGNGFHS